MSWSTKTLCFLPNISYFYENIFGVLYPLFSILLTMKFFFFLLAVSIFSTPIVGYAVDRNLSPRYSLSIRALPEPERPPPPEEPIPEPKVVNPQPNDQPKNGYLAGGIATYQSIKEAFQKLPATKWGKWVMSQVEAIQRFLGYRPEFRGDPTTLIEVNDFGYPVTARDADLTDEIFNLREVKNTGGRIWILETNERPIWSYDPVKQQIVAQGLSFTVKYFSPREAVSSFIATGEVLPIKYTMEKRSVPLSALDGSSDTTPAATFEQYLELYYAAQSVVQTAVRPVLNNITAQTNSTLVHQMADSIYYDLTGSTTALIGPFNNGMSFLDKNLTDPSVANLTNAVQKIYVGMYVKAYLAANATGAFEQQLQLASILNTNDTSIYPPGFTTVSSISKGR